MMNTRYRLGPRPARGHQLKMLLWLAALFVGIGVCLSNTGLHASAQSPGSAAPDTGPGTTPDTVVLPRVQLHLPLAFGEAANAVECPVTSLNSYETTPILGSPRDPDIPPSFDPDLNLLMRGHQAVNAAREVVAINGPTDDDAPQLAHLFRPPRVPPFRAVYQIRDWDWRCCPGGKLGSPISEPEVTLVEMETVPGEAIYPPRRNANIDGSNFVAMVLYAETFRITITYTRDDSPAFGYVVHLENLCVDPTLLALYQSMHAAGRTELPALQRSDVIGLAHSESIMVAVRDSGSFMDPRSGKDWWQDTVRAILAAQAQ